MARSSTEGRTRKGGRPPLPAQRRRDARVQSFITPLQLLQVQVIARYQGGRTKEADVFRRAVSHYLASEALPDHEWAEWMTALRKDLLDALPEPVRALELSGQEATERIDFSLTRAQRDDLDARAVEDGFTRSGAAAHAVNIYVADQFRRTPDMADMLLALIEADGVVVD